MARYTLTPVERPCAECRKPFKRSSTTGLIRFFCSAPCLEAWHKAGKGDPLAQALGLVKNVRTCRRCNSVLSTKGKYCLGCRVWHKTLATATSTRNAKRLAQMRQAARVVYQADSVEEELPQED